MSRTSDSSKEAKCYSEKEKEPKCRTIMWSVPRSVSTALTKCIAAGVPGDSAVWFEPFSYCRAISIIASAKHNIPLPLEYEGNEKIFEQAAAVVGNMYSCEVHPERLAYGSIKRLLESAASPCIFVKDLAQAMNKERLQYLPQGYKHVFLIRHPLRVFHSFRKIAFANTAKFASEGDSSKPTISEDNFDIEKDYVMFDSAGLYFRGIHETWKYVKENFEGDPIVMDGDDLLAKPAEMIPKFCEAIGLSYNKTMLEWSSSADMVKKWVHPAEGLVDELRYIYGRALTSSEFAPANPMPSRDQVTPDVIRLTDQVMKFYEEMYESRMKV
ncbi:uncharacterized protein LOC100890128 [Strongylocentrotus purpuratus]|uniref:Sulfotransferase n=1 Tax=Strongylocentrotus purpuratus TaxID=7668 RepID=A0A7M7GGF4_STRPU|nr:uncharacterized protein LOC100890128 [Strongylocentrotus purpuratus]|eukprot:XP_003725061.2 PREDICTED: uncharacterized protein LOC100890128 [Strongylocentrotus purpuratus]